MNRPGLKITMIILIALFIFLPGCSGKNKESAAKKPETSSQKKAPPETKEILSDLEKIIASLGKKIAMEKMPKQQAPAGLFPEDQKQSGQGQGGQDQQSGQGESQSGQNQEQTGKKQSGKMSGQDQMNNWQVEETSLKNIHRKWNTLEPDAIKAGLGISERDGFEQALDKLTMEISQQKKNGSLIAAIELYGQYARLVKVFEMPVPADFYNTKYEIMAASAEAANDEWSKAQERVPKIKEYWNHFKLQAKVKDEKLMSRSDFSVEDFLQSLNSKLLDTLIIKAEIVLNNLQQLEKQMSSNTSSQQ